MKESKDARRVYGDIIDLPYQKNRRRKQMTLYDRAAQFAPFAALTGYDAMVQEEARLTENRKELSEYELEVLDRKLNSIAGSVAQGKHPLVTVVYFVPDAYKSGGKYESIRAVVRMVDVTEQCLMLYGSDNIEDKTVSPVLIRFENIRDVQEEAIQSPDF